MPTVSPLRRPRPRPTRAFSAGQVLTAWGPRLPAAIVSAEGLRRAAAPLAALPAQLFPTFGIETRLGDPAPVVDVSACLSRRGRAALLRRGPEAFFPPDTGHPHWDRFAALLADWADPATDLHRHVPSLWLEFDAADAGEAGAPLVFIDRPETADADLGTDGPAKARRYEALAAALVYALVPAPPPALAGHLARCVGALPEGASLSGIGAVQRPGAAGLRLSLYGIRRDGLGAYLRAIGWPGDVAELTGQLDAAAPRALAPHPDAIGILDIDVWDAVGPTVGVECFFARAPQRERAQLPHGAWMDHLVASGLCTPEKRAGLAAWPGATRERFPHELWASRAVRWASHVKLKHRPGRPLEAKAYLGLRYAPASR